MSVYIFLILSENATLDVIVFHCDFYIPKLTSQSSNGTIEIIQTFLAPLLKNYFKISKSCQNVSIQNSLGKGSLRILPKFHFL